MPGRTFGSRCIMRCGSCGNTVVGKRRLDGSLHPIGVSECPCGDGDFRPVMA